MRILSCSLLRLSWQTTMDVRGLYSPEKAFMDLSSGEATRDAPLTSTATSPLARMKSTS